MPDSIVFVRCNMVKLQGFKPVIPNKLLQLILAFKGTQLHSKARFGGQQLNRIVGFFFLSRLDHESGVIAGGEPLVSIKRYRVGLPNR